MKNMTKWAAMALLTTAAGCSNSDNGGSDAGITDSQVTPVSIDITPAEQQLVDAGNDFTFNLFRESRHLTMSQVLSPVSVTYALGMLNNGAAGQTQEQINTVLGFGQAGAAAINDYCYKMLVRASKLDEKTRVMIANTIFVNNDMGCELLPDFQSKAKLFYQAVPEARSFSDGKTRNVINQWASDHTEQMIKEVLSADEFSANAVSYLLNAIYFKGIWAMKFDKAQTRDEVFNHIGLTNEVIYKPMMRMVAQFPYAENSLYQALQLPYGNGAYQMTVLLPREKDNLDGIMASLNATSWQQLQQQLDSTLVDLKLPRFEASTDLDLVPVMKKLGMSRAFDSTQAEFPLFCNKDIYIGLMKQVAKIMVDEEGTEAAAVTVIGVKEMADIEPQTVLFHANCPFIYLISEKETGAVLFIGQYTGY